MPKKGQYIRFKIYERKIKLPFMIYADFESKLVPEDKGKQNPNESYTKTLKNIACSYGHRLACADDKFSKFFKWCLSEDHVYNFINSKIKEGKCCSEVMKKHFNKELAITKKDNEDFTNSTKYWIFDNSHVDGDVKVKGHSHITGKYRGSVHRDCNINVKLNHKIPIIFHNLKNYDSHFILQELCKLNLKINVIPNGWRRSMSININNKLIFIYNFQFYIFLDQ